VKKIKEFYIRYCSRCGKLFKPTGRNNYLCEICLEKSRKEGAIRRKQKIEWMKKNLNQENARTVEKI